MSDTHTHTHRLPRLSIFYYLKKKKTNQKQKKDFCVQLAWCYVCGGTWAWLAVLVWTIWSAWLGSPVSPCSDDFRSLADAYPSSCPSPLLSAAPPRHRSPPSSPSLLSLALQHQSRLVKKAQWKIDLHYKQTIHHVWFPPIFIGDIWRTFLDISGHLKENSGTFQPTFWASCTFIQYKNEENPQWESFYFDV